MKLNKIQLKNFRNYDNLFLGFHPNLNIFLGQNAQGKTNILESIYFLALTRSHRTNHDSELIRWGAETMSIKGEIEKNGTRVPLELQLSKAGRLAKVNHLRERKIADYIGHLNVVMFAPEDLELIKGAPAIRRRFLDMELGQIKVAYLYDSVRYNRILKQRNIYLKENFGNIDPIFLDVLDEQLVDYGNKIMITRNNFIENLEKIANEIHHSLSHGVEDLKLIYEKKVVSDFASELKKARSHDAIRRQTSIGPHRDNLQFFVNGIDASSFGSQGQQRTIILSIKLAEIELIFQETGEYPILLLDDVMSELDNIRQIDLLETSIGKAQTFLTTTTLDHLKNLPTELQIFNVTAGNIKKSEDQ
ncbi:DNA replication/repair protein RecF [Lactovum miscens]|uniref:DNA replication and repair protein RecF n=1 Tax=Lactovum miscens TaxID=190387 RepID=A0A841C721_9LACT|nr:DNA replication/repair protein RecF [Lactovum miscens]MBB5887392.1 DNA replication and repair protein RecF [Lactovum miscens]